MTAAPAPLTLRLDALALSRGGKTLCAGIDLVLEPGDALIVTGPNGAGKTTLLRALAGLYSPDSGGVFYGGEPARAAAPRHVAWLGHADGLKPAETPLQALAFWARLHGSDPASGPAALEAMGLAALRDRPAGRLSRGQKRRAALARIIASGRPVWLLDEPAGPLDAAGRDRLAAAVAAHRGRGGIAVAATHQLLDWTDARALELGA